MKVIHVIASIDFSVGGPAKSVSDLAFHLANQGIKNIIFTIQSDEPYFKISPHLNLELRFVKKKDFYKELYRLVCSESFDLLHGHSLWDMPVHYMAKIARKKKIPYIITPRGTLEPWALNAKKWKKRIAMFLYQRNDLLKAACIQATAKMEATNIRSLGFQNSIAYIPNGIEIKDYSLSNITRKENIRTLFYLSRIHPKKGIEILIKAWQNIDVSIKKNWQIKIAGAGDENYILSLNKLIGKCGLTNEIQLIGPIYGSAKNEALYNADLFVLPTYSENFGVVIAEALVCGVPVITTMGTPWEDLNTYNAGWWIEIGVDPLVEALEHSMQLTDKERQIMGENGRKLVELNYSIQSVALKMIELYKWVTGETNESIFLYRE